MTQCTTAYDHPYTELCTNSFVTAEVILLALIMSAHFASPFRTRLTGCQKPAKVISVEDRDVAITESLVFAKSDLDIPSGHLCCCLVHLSM